MHYCHLNGYPRDFVDTRIGIGLTKYPNKNNNNNNEESNLPVAGCEKQRLFAEIPFIGEQTDLMKKKIQQLTGSIRPDLDVRFVAKSPRTGPDILPNQGSRTETSAFKHSVRDNMQRMCRHLREDDETTNRHSSV